MTLRTLVFLLLPCAALAEAPYRSKGFLKLPESARIGEISSVAVAQNGNMYVLHRGEPPILEFDASGAYRRGWGDGLFKTAHGIRIHRDGTIWTTDNGNHVLRRFSRDGKLLKTYGTVGVPAKGRDGFKSPDDLVFTGSGEIFVADSGNSRIVRLAADGSYLSEFGRKGTAPGEFATPHGLAIDSQDRIYVADRGNQRVQVFDTAGQQLAIWSGFGNPFGLLISGSELILSNGDTNRIYQLGLDGAIREQWGSREILMLPHFLALSPSGDLLVAEIDGKRIQIFAPHPAARK